MKLILLLEFDASAFKALCKKHLILYLCVSTKQTGLKGGGLYMEYVFNLHAYSN